MAMPPSLALTRPMQPRLACGSPSDRLPGPAAVAAEVRFPLWRGWPDHSPSGACAARATMRTSRIPRSMARSMAPVYIVDEPTSTSFCRRQWSCRSTRPCVSIGRPEAATWRRVFAVPRMDDDPRMVNVARPMCCQVLPLSRDVRRRPACELRKMLALAGTDPTIAVRRASASSRWLRTPILRRRFQVVPSVGSAIAPRP